MECHNYILFEGFWETVADTKFEKMWKNLKMLYLHFIQTKLDSKGGQIKGLDVTFQMHSIAKIFDIVKYLKNEKNQKLKTKKKERE